MVDRVEAFVACALEQTHTRDLKDCFLEFVETQFDFRFVAYTLVAEKFKRLSSDKADRICKIPSALKNSFDRERAISSDPMLRVARMTSGPILWRDVKQRSDIAPAENEFVDELKMRGLWDGVALSFCTKPGQIVYFSASPGESELAISAFDLRLFALVCHEFHTRYEALIGPKAAHSLSVREREIMNWIVQGKSNAYIADALKISPHTVDTLLRRCFSKLNARNRVEAALKSVSLGLALS